MAFNSVYASSVLIDQSSDTGPFKAVASDDEVFVGTLFDTILYERACYRLNQLKKYDFPLKYDELAYDFLSAYRLCLEPKFLHNRHTATFATLLVNSKMLTPKGVRAFVLRHNGKYDIYPSDDTGYLDEKDVDELNEDEFSDFDEVNHGFGSIRKQVGYQGPPLITIRSNLLTILEDIHGKKMADGYYKLDKHSQDMIAVIIAHLRKRVWYNNGSGGKIVEIKNMGVDGRSKEKDDDNDDDDDSTIHDGTRDHPIKNVKGVDKYTRRFNGKRKRADYVREMINRSSYSFEDLNRDPPTEYSDSDEDGEDGLVKALDRVHLDGFTGSALRNIRWLPAIRSRALYDWNGVNQDLRLIDLPTEQDDAAFYGCLTRDIMKYYQTLLPPPELTEKHRRLQERVEKTISEAFPTETLKVEPYGSFVSGLLMANSDADFVITGPNVNNHTSLNDMHFLAEVLEHRGGMKYVSPVPHAMVPIVKFTDPETNIECDINTGNNLGVYNSDLIRIYTTLDERVKPFLYVIKAICRAQGINDSRSGYLSSYAITWMGIVFLQQPSDVISPSTSREWGWGPVSILPKLQQQPFERMKSLSLRIKHNTKGNGLVNFNSARIVAVFYDENKDGKHTNQGRTNPKSLARLLIEFFEFFSRRFNYTSMAINVGGGDFGRKLKDMNDGTFRVIDPFLHHRNITGPCRGDSLGRVWKVFDYVYQMLSSGDLEAALRKIE